MFPPTQDYKLTENLKRSHSNTGTKGKVHTERPGRRPAWDHCSSMSPTPIYSILMMVLQRPRLSVTLIALVLIEIIIPVLFFLLSEIAVLLFFISVFLFYRFPGEIQAPCCREQKTSSHRKWKDRYNWATNICWVTEMIENDWGPPLINAPQLRGRARCSWTSEWEVLTVKWSQLPS